MQNEYINNPQELVDIFEDKVKIWQGYVKRQPGVAGTPYNRGYMQALDDIIADGVAQYASYTESQLEALYTQKANEYKKKYGRTDDVQYGGYMQVYGDLYKVCVTEDACEVIHEVDQAKAELGIV